MMLNWTDLTRSQIDQTVHSSYPGHCSFGDLPDLKSMAKHGKWQRVARVANMLWVQCPGADVPRAY